MSMPQVRVRSICVCCWYRDKLCNLANFARQRRQADRRVLLAVSASVMAASLLRLGISRRLKIIKLTSDTISNLKDVIAVINCRILASNYFSKHEVLSLQQICHFHSSCSSVYAKKDENWRRDFLLARLDKKKREKIEVWANISVSEIASKLKRDPEDILDALYTHIPDGHFYKSKTDRISNSKILIDLVKFFGKAPVFVTTTTVGETEKSHLDAYPRPPSDPQKLVKRPPIVTIMGHVDHGKTTLLDYLRKANVVASEFGGITQHIGAFSVNISETGSVTFIDTPGHAAFASMRSRGAHATDIVVLVVAADDGVMEQTLESIRMAQEAGATIIVAINKIDKAGADVKRTEEMLAQHQLYTENMGGDIQAVPISALNGTNVDSLVEAILVQAEMMELKADPSGLVEGVILESKVDVQKGKIASAIIHRGTLKKGAYLVAGTAYAKVRQMCDESGQQISKAPPSTPLEMMGWKDLPSAGELMLEVDSEKRAQQVVKYRKSRESVEKALADHEVVRQRMQEHHKMYTDKRRKAYEQGYTSLREPKPKESVIDDTPKVKIIIKGDVDGSVEAILDVLETYHGSAVPLDIVHFAVGEPNPSDLEIASTFDAIIYCFNVRTPASVREEADKLGVSIRNMNVIYHLVDDIKKELQSKMPTVEKEEVLGQAEVLQQFDITEKRKTVFVAGVKVTKGEIVATERVKLIRNEEVLFDGPIASLRHLKKEVNSMKSGTECGIMLGDPTIGVKLGDVIICYKSQSVPLKLQWDTGF